MVRIYSRENCAYCPMVRKYLDMKKVPYEELKAEGNEYETLANLYGYTVPLIVNGEKGMVGYNIGQLNDLLKQ